MKLWRHGT